MPQLGHAADSPWPPWPLVTQRNSRMCRSDAEGMETVWRSSPVRCSSGRHAARSESGARRNELALSGAGRRVPPHRCRRGYEQNFGNAA
jgi:hypothetical protein